MMMYHQTKFGMSYFGNKTYFDNVSPHCDYDLEDSNPVQDTLVYDDVSPHQALITNGSAVQKISRQRIKILNVCCDLDLEDSNPIFSLDTLAYHGLPSN